MDASDKETRAIFLNFKELRCLEKNVQALDLEKDFNVRLINLNQKVVKVHYKKLKDKVARIKSHLKPEEIEELQKLEEDGKLINKSADKISESEMKIAAAARRLKLMPRAKSAVPRLESSRSDADVVNTPRAARVVRTGITRLVSSATPRSTREQVTDRRPSTAHSTSKSSSLSAKNISPNRPASTRDHVSNAFVQYPTAESKSTSRPSSVKISTVGSSSVATLITTPVSPRQSTSARRPSSARCIEAQEQVSNFPVPRSVREDRRMSINLFDLNELNETSNHKNAGLEMKKSPGNSPRSNVSKSKVNGTHLKENGSKSPKVAVSGRQLVVPQVSIQVFDEDQGHGKPGECDEKLVIPVPTSPEPLQLDSPNMAMSRCSNKLSPSAGNNQSDGKENLANSTNSVNLNGTANQDKCNDKSLSFLEIPQNPGMSLNGEYQTTSNSVSSLSTSLVRPKTAQVAQTAETDNKQPQKHPMTAIERAIETRKISVMEIKRASALLREGKTRSPFSCHEKDRNINTIKPFRSIRDGVLSSIPGDNDLLDITMGDDLFKDMKKGLLLGEVASSLYLEDKIDHFLEKVDIYVKENPNYVYDPEAAKAKRVPKPKVKPKPKRRRNRLRRRQLERTLMENDIEEMKKSRWLRMDDDKLDISGMNTLVVDQMRMLNKLKHPYDDDSD